MSTSDPVLYPEPAGTTEALRQEAARARADVAQTMELLADRMTPSRVLRPLVSAPVVAGVVTGIGVWVVMLRSRVLREIAWVGGLTAAAVAFAGARRVAAPSTPPPLAPAARTGRNDVVDLLLDQHRQIVAAFDAVNAAAPGQDRLETFASLVELLRHHERAEQHVVHPVMASLADQTDQTDQNDQNDQTNHANQANDVAQARVEEEEAADRMLASLVSMGVDDPNFEPGLARLQQMVADHAAHEETQEFPILRERISPARLRQLAGDVVRSP